MHTSTDPLTIFQRYLAIFLDRGDGSIAISETIKHTYNAQVAALAAALEQATPSEMVALIARLRAQQAPIIPKQQLTIFLLISQLPYRSTHYWPADEPRWRDGLIVATAEPQPPFPELCWSSEARWCGQFALGSIAVYLYLDNYWSINAQACRAIEQLGIPTDGYHHPRSAAVRLAPEVAAHPAFVQATELRWDWVEARAPLGARTRAHVPIPVPIPLEQPRFW